MAGKAGRPSRKEAAASGDAKQKIIDAAVKLIKKEGADKLTVRKVVEISGLSVGTFYHHFSDKDDLLMYFVKETSFEEITLKTPVSDPAGRVCELYMHLIRRYMDLGCDFMKSFYTTGNKALSSYMGTGEDTFPADTVMARCEEELRASIAAGILLPDSDAHQISADICTIVKGCVFEWCLSDGSIPIEDVLRGILQRYFSSYVITKDL